MIGTKRKWERGWKHKSWNMKVSASSYSPGRFHCCPLYNLIMSTNISHFLLNLLWVWFTFFAIENILTKKCSSVFDYKKTLNFGFPLWIYKYKRLNSETKNILDMVNSQCGNPYCILVMKMIIDKLKRGGKWMTISQNLFFK